MKKSTRRTMMMSSLAMLIVAVLALGTATYAWFTSSNQGSITNIEFSATSAGGIEFSTNGTTWKSDLDFVNDFGLSPKVFAPISAHTTLANDTFNLFGGYIPNEEQDPTNAGNIVITGPASADNYYEMVFYVRNSADEDITVSLTNATISDTATTANGSTIHTSYATRLGMILSNPAENGTAVGDIGNQAASSYIMQPAEGFDAEYHGIIAAGVWAPDAVDTHIAATGQDGVAAQATNAVAPTDVSFSIPASSFLRVRLFVWLEGQDHDCDNSLGSGAVAINLFFEKN